jgi:hypothetical protein
VEDEYKKIPIFLYLDHQLSLSQSEQEPYQPLLRPLMMLILEVMAEQARSCAQLIAAELLHSVEAVEQTLEFIT